MNAPARKIESFANENESVDTGLRFVVLAPSEGGLPADLVSQLRDVLGKMQAVNPSATQGPRDAANANDDPPETPAPVTAAVTPRDLRGKRTEQSTTMTATTQATTQGNTPTVDDLMKVAAELGEQAGNGKDVQIKFDLKILEAAFLSGLDLDPNKHGADIDDATKLSEAYVKAQGSATVFDAKAANQRKLVSNVRKCIRLGMWPKGGPGEPLQTVNTLVSLRLKLRKDPATAKKLDDAHNMLMRFATAQLKRDQIIGESELPGFCYKNDPAERTAEQVIEGIRKTLNNLKVGKIANCHELDDSKEVQDMIRLATKRLVEVAKAKGGNPPVK